MITEYTDRKRYLSFEDLLSSEHYKYITKETGRSHGPCFLRSLRRTVLL